MDSALPMLLFFGFLLGFGTLILACGYRSRELDREETGPSLEDLALEGIPRFFGAPGTSAIANPVTLVVDESSLARLERFLQEELALVEVFVKDPSVEVLHRSREDDSRVSPIARLESFLRKEHEAAASFVLNPSLESLHGAHPALATIG